MEGDTRKMTAARVGGGARALLLAAAAAAVIVVCAAVLVPAAARASELESSDMKYAPRQRERERERGRERGSGCGTARFIGVRRVDDLHRRWCASFPSLTVVWCMCIAGRSIRC